jgi:hypothetical protein
MTLSRTLKAVAATAFGATAIALSGSGCSLPQEGLQGPITHDVLSDSHTPIDRMTVKGDTLKPKINYTFNNVSVTIEGNIPANVTVHGKNGQLIVTGDVGDKDKIHVDVPENTQFVPQTCTGMQQTLIGFTDAGNGVQIPNYIYVPYDYDCSHTDDISPKAPYDKDPVIIIKGKTGNKVSLSGSAGTKIVQLGPR